MPLSGDDEQAIDDALQAWRQGDVSLDTGLEFVHFADLSRPHSQASRQVADAYATGSEPVPMGPSLILDKVSGFAMLSQTCDIVRSCRDRPFVEVAPLALFPADFVAEVRRLKRPAFAYIPAVADPGFVADLDRTMTVEKALVARWTRISGCQTDEDRRDFADALARKRSRFAFPDDFVRAARRVLSRIADKLNRSSPEGAHLRALREIRVRADPSWGDSLVRLSWWFIKEADPDEFDTDDWHIFADQWLSLFDTTGRFRLDSPTVCRLSDMTAQDYVESDRFELDHLSVPHEA